MAKTGIELANEMLRPVRIKNGQDANATKPKLTDNSIAIGNKTVDEIETALAPKDDGYRFPYDEESRKKIIGEWSPEQEEQRQAHHDSIRAKLKERMEKNYFSFPTEDYLNLSDEQYVRTDYLLSLLEDADKRAKTGDPSGAKDYDRYYNYIISGFRKAGN